MEAEGTKDRGISIYLHIPFCLTLCTFCGCNKVITRDAELVERYLKALEQEMAAVAKGLGQRKTLSQLHLGGGTPTFLSLDQLTRLTEMLKHNFEIDPEGECALEANPRVTRAEQLEGLFDLGFRRVSFGIQDIDPPYSALSTATRPPRNPRKPFPFPRNSDIRASTSIWSMGFRCIPV